MLFLILCKLRCECDIYFTWPHLVLLLINMEDRLLPKQQIPPLHVAEMVQWKGKSNFHHPLKQLEDHTFPPRCYSIRKHLYCHSEDAEGCNMHLAVASTHVFHVLTLLLFPIARRAEEKCQTQPPKKFLPSYQKRLFVCCLLLERFQMSLPNKLRNMGWLLKKTSSL